MVHSNFRFGKQLWYLNLLTCTDQWPDFDILSKTGGAGNKVKRPDFDMMFKLETDETQIVLMTCFKIENWTDTECQCL